ncbi:MAG: hypothetical protein VB086_11430 [Clostridiaceae bacterium]|nr:hypothetical protein [Clostridiaceae bacterium]
MDPKTCDRMFLMACFQENLSHARHVENERITFFSLYLVGVGMILGVAMDNSQPVVSILMTLLLLGMSVISTVLLKRWNQVFEGHRQTARRLCTLLCDDNGESDVNYFYYFDNQSTLSRRRSRFYVHTAQLFEIFNLLICLVEIFTMAFYVYRWTMSGYGL